MRTITTLMLLAGIGSAKDSPFAGTWELEMVRDGMQPRVAKAVLTLTRKDKEWTGSLRFRHILYARDYELTDVNARGRRIRFRVDHKDFQLDFEGKRAGKALEGRCNWKRLGVYPWTATRKAEVVRIEKGLRTKLPQAAPADVGLDAAALDSLIEAAEAAHTTSLVVLKDGKLVCERHFDARRPQRIHVMSVTKFLTAMATAMLVHDEKIESLDLPLSTWFPKHDHGVTLRHLLNHTSGILDPGNARVLNQQKDKVKYVRGLPVPGTPGATFAYNNNAVALLSGVLAQAAGEPVDAYLARRLFKPMAIRDWSWDRDGAGHTLTYANLAMTARDLAKVGLLVAQRGRWQNKTLFPPAWIDRLAAPGPRKKECGLLWWNADGRAIYHTGWLGQWLVVFPQENLVGVRLRRFDGRESDAAREMGGFLGLLEATLGG